MKTGIELIQAERQRQIDKEGYTPDHDAGHTGGELALVAALYATPLPLYTVSLDDDRNNPRKGYRGLTVELDDPWPSEWESRFDKRGQHDRLRQLTIAGALIAAEIDRLLTAEVHDDRM